MDPNETLKGIRRIVAKGMDGDINLSEYDDLITLFDSLDGWLARGGFLPEPWSLAAPGNA